MADKRRPVEPARPQGMEVLFFYVCPHCGKRMGIASPTKPHNVRCESCGQPFPIIPVDEHGLQYIRIMLGNGMAAVDPDFL